MDSQTLSILQRQFGSVDYNRWEYIRQPYWSAEQYPLAGSTRITFFGQATGALNLQRTNMPKAASFGQNHFLVKKISFGYFHDDENMSDVTWSGLDAATLFTELFFGCFQCGALTFDIGSKRMLELPLPFLSAPPGASKFDLWGQGVVNGDSVVGSHSKPANAYLATAQNQMFVLDPEILIAAEQAFTVSLEWPSGLVPITATSQVDAGNPLYIQCVLDGILIRPIQ